MTGEVKRGETYDLVIVKLGRQGDGMAFLNGFVIFVRGGKVGPCTVKITKVKSTFAVGVPA